MPSSLRRSLFWIAGALFAIAALVALSCRTYSPAETVVLPRT
jgi:hypothetical protein